jgi:4-amino-4-deoxy-L-arabinose transferase-like glycosyltransferase
LEAVPRLRPAPTLAVLGLALGMRLLVVWTVLMKYPARWVFTRGEEMGLLAVSLLHGQGLGSPFRVPTGPTAFLAPVYPILVAGVFRVFGEYSTASAVFVMCAQSAVNLLTIYLMMRIARRLFSQTAATVAGLIWAVSFPLVWMPTIFWETSLSCCLLTGLLAMVLRLRELPRMRALHWMGLGAYCGLAALVNPALLLALVAVSLWLVFQRRGNAGAAPLLAALAFAVVFAPWPIRNARVFHAFIPLRTTVGFELWMGNHPGSTGFLDETLFPTFNAAELADYKARGEVAYTDRKAALAKEYIRENPGRFALLTAIRTVRFWSGTGSHPGSAIFAAHALFTTVLGFCGLWLLARSRRYGLAILFALPMAVFPLPYMMTHAEFRYRLVLDPVMTLCAGYAAAEIFRRMQVPASGSAPAAAGVGREATTAIGGECIAGRTG